MSALPSFHLRGDLFALPEQSSTGLSVIENACRIPLPGERFTLVDADDFMKFGQLRWSLSRNGYVRRTLKTKNPSVMQLHREIMGLTHGDGLLVDHINRDRLDNRKTNLRICSKSENSFNMGFRSHNKSGFRGVRFIESKGRWKAEIGYQRKTRHIGMYDTAEEAHAAFCAAAKQYYGQFFNPMESKS